MNLLSKVTGALQKFLMSLCTAVSFLLLFPTLVFVAYYLFVCYDISRVIAGVIVLCACIHLNKSL